MKVYAPNKAFNGNIGDATFRDGVAEVDEKSNALPYFRRHGFGLGKRAEDPDVAPEWDARDIARTGPHRVGTPLRDAAVDPRPEDFLAPTNAGKADPHGPQVVAPEIHASGPAGVKPGDVHVGDPDQQDADETALAVTVLVNQEEHPSQPAPDPETGDVPDVDRGPLGLSDPGSVQLATTPARSASKGSWVEWAVSHGADRGEAEEATRAELIERYGGEG